MSQADNVTQFPTREQDKRWVCAFSSRYLGEMFDGTGWIHAADVLEGNADYLSAGMRDFVAQMKRKKKRPTTAQLALLVSLIVNVEAQRLFLAWAEDEKAGRRVKKEASVIPLNSNI